MADKSIRKEVAATMSDVSDDIKRGSQRTLDAARERFEDLAEEVQGRYERTADDVRRSAEKAGRELRRGAESAREKAEAAARTLREGYGKARAGARTAAREVSDYVHENPGKSILIAALVGFLIGLFVRRRGD